MMSGISFGYSSGGILGTWFGPLLFTCKQYLAGLSPAPYSQDAIWVYMGRPEDLMDHPPRENFLVISAITGQLDQPLASGGGNFTPAIRGQITLTQFARLFEDRPVQDQERLGKASLGLSDQSRALFKVMELWTGTVQQNATPSPLKEPARLAGPIRFNARRIPLGWACVDSVWEVPFNADLS